MQESTFQPKVSLRRKINDICISGATVTLGIFKKLSQAEMRNELKEISIAFIICLCRRSLVKLHWSEIVLRILSKIVKRLWNWHL